MQHESRCTLIIPTYNASSFIDDTVDSLSAFVKRHADWEVLFVCDGCADDTVERLTRAIGKQAKLAERLRVVSYPLNRGKGFAVRRGLDLARGEYRVFTDVDLSYAPEEAVKLAALLREGADVVVANRADPRSQFLISCVEFSHIYRRHIMSRTFNWWIRRMLPITILDTQAGLKGVTASAWEALREDMRTDGFFFDVELLARAGARGMRIVETPVSYRYVDPSTVKMISHGGRMILDTLKLRRRLKQVERRVIRPVAPVMREIGGDASPTPVSLESAGAAEINRARVPGA